MLKILKARFEENKNRHPDVTWETVEALLAQDDNKLSKIKWMEQSGGEPDVILCNDTLLFCDCSKESPKSRRSLCYDGEARLSRKKILPCPAQWRKPKKQDCGC